MSLVSSSYRKYDTNPQDSWGLDIVINANFPSGFEVIDRIHDDRGLLEELKLDNSSIATWTYDSGGRMDEQSYSSGVDTTYSYRDDANGKDNMIESIDTTHPGGSAPYRVDDFSYTYDANKNKTSEVISGQLSDYGFNSSASPASFDAENRLTGWNRTDGNQDQSWSLSLVGDWDSFTEEGTQVNGEENGDTYRVFVLLLDKP